MTSAQFCGLDFGTSNSTIGIYQAGQCQLVPLDGPKIPLRSAIFYAAELQQLLFGQAGIDAYLSGMDGRLLMSLKSILGSSLMQDQTLIFNELVPYTEILQRFLQQLKQQAEQLAGTELTQVVLGRPVHFHDDDAVKDKLAETTLATVARRLGFTEVEFQYEPIAAALAYEQTINEPQLALIIDLGGGTSDFSIIKLRPNNTLKNRAADVLANHGIHLGGTDFDKALSLQSVMPLLGKDSWLQGSSHTLQVPNSFYYDLTTWHRLNYLYTATTLAQVQAIYTTALSKPLIKRLLDVLHYQHGHAILNAVELSKQQLSAQTHVALDLNFIETQLSAPLTRAQFNAVIAADVQKIQATVQQTLQQAQVNCSKIDAIFYTGGSTKIPYIRAQINALLPQANVIEGDAFGSVGLGLTLDAQRRFG